MSYLTSLASKRSQRRRKPRSESRALPPSHKPVNRDATAAALQAASYSNRNKKGALTPRRMAIVTSIALHVVGAVVGTAYVVQKTIFEDEVVTVQVMQAAPKPAVKRMSRPRVSQRPEAPQPLPAQKLALQRTLTTDARIPLGDARFTLLSGPLASGTIDAPRDTAAERRSIMGERDAQVATIPTTFEAPRMTNSMLSNFSTATNFAEMSFNPEAMNPIMTTAELGATTQSFSEYLREIRAKIKRAQRYPPTVRQTVDGTTKVRFTVRRDGSLVDFEVVESSGSNTLDNAALDAIRNAAPFPAFPEGQNAQQVRLEIPISFEFRA